MDFLLFISILILYYYKNEQECISEECVFPLQEPEGTKTNNGIHYRLQLLFANGKNTTLFYRKVFNIHIYYIFIVILY